ncbi:MAG TPA: IPT/TIG domain-containing protein, partial [Candidatus Solibacter sp.]|nr:IPT/TIG domain-containing protein [Candidatus Solibacter sp.]
AHVTAQIPADDVAGAGRAAVSAFNASTGGGSSLPKNFNIGSAPQTASNAFVSAANPTGGNQLAPLSIGSLYGKNLAGALAVAGVPPLPFTMRGVTLTIGGAFAPLFFVSPEQINFQVPNIVASGPATVTLTITQGAQSTSVPVVLRPTAPSIFTTNAQGTGQGSIVIAGTATLALPARPAKIGEFISIYCTGLGAVSNSPGVGNPAPGNPLAQTQSTPTVMIGGVPATVQFSGLAPGFAGLYQINVRVPTGVAAGDAVPITITMGGVTSNTATIAVSQ